MFIVLASTKKSLYDGCTNTVHKNGTRRKRRLSKHATDCLPGACSFCTGNKTTSWPRHNSADWSQRANRMTVRPPHRHISHSRDSWPGSSTSMYVNSSSSYCTGETCSPKATQSRSRIRAMLWARRSICFSNDGTSKNVRRAMGTSAKSGVVEDATGPTNAMAAPSPRSSSTCHRGCLNRRKDTSVVHGSTLGRLSAAAEIFHDPEPIFSRNTWRRLKKHLRCCPAVGPLTSGVQTIRRVRS
ncbi:hypothetical protein OJF2_14200 [Aquisphaera giovannonii]|uniref:Uncharacterized protein n=1 Tax=Aquisphaera giovannonii TaxID=406548 RepID=A0A5B9VXD6_9BACT|nr:hypothetical protein OJF2_14200 [Aquisphaera giovannonii]